MIEGEDEEKLQPEETKRFRGLAARAHFLAQDRAGIVFATKELTRIMAMPSKHDWDTLVGLGRYFALHPRVVHLEGDEKGSKLQLDLEDALKNGFDLRKGLGLRFRKAHAPTTQTHAELGTKCS